MTKHKVVVRDGHRMAVIRPADPKKALIEAQDVVGATITQEEKVKRFNKILQSQAYTFVGLLSQTVEEGTPVVLDPRSLEPNAHVQPGDSFVSYEQLLERELDRRGGALH